MELLFYFLLVDCVNVAHWSRTERTAESVANKQVHERVIRGGEEADRRSV